MKPAYNIMGSKSDEAIQSISISREERPVPNVSMVPKDGKEMLQKSIDPVRPTVPAEGSETLIITPLAADEFDHDPSCHNEDAMITSGGTMMLHGEECMLSPSKESMITVTGATLCVVQSSNEKPCKTGTVSP